MSTTTDTPPSMPTTTQPQPRGAFWVTAGLVVAWLAGIGVQEWLGLPLWFATAAVVGATGLAMGALVGRLSSVAVGLAVVFALFWAGAARAEISAPDRGESGVLYYATGLDVRLTGIIEGDPNVSASGKSVTFRLTSRQIGGHDVSGGVQVRAFVGRETLGDGATTREWQAGDLVEVRGALEPIDPRAISSDDGYSQYLTRQGIYARIDYPRLRLLADKQDNPVVHALGDLRHAATDGITQNVGDQEGALLVGILLGNKNGINAEIRSAFQNSGTSHIIAISGSNISIVIAFVIWTCGRWLGRRNAMFVAVLFVVAYTIMVGASASVVRAALMGIIAAFGLVVGRAYYGLSALGVAAFLMTLYDPHLFWDVGFQLSCMATLGILLLGESFQKRLRLLPPLVRETVALTLAAEIFVLPLTAFYFSGISKTSVIANILTVPALPVIMATGTIAIIGGAIGFIGVLGVVTGAIAKVFLAYMILMVEMFSVPLLDTKHVSPLVLVYYYTALALALSYTQLRQWGNPPQPFAMLQNLSRLQNAVIAVLVGMCGVALLLLT